jgi:malonate transporter and related proteins
MISTFLIVLPIFALILSGYLARRIGVLGEAAPTELNRYVVYLALPALLFDITSHAHWRELWRPGFIAAFGLATLVMYVGILIVRVSWRGVRPADGAIDGLSASYANTAYIGFPLTLAVFGKDGLTLATVASIITVCILFALAIVMIEFAIQAKASVLDVSRKVGLSLARNPLIVAPVLGAVFAAAGLPVPVPAETFFKMLGETASPCALVVVGLFLAGQNASGDGQARGTAALATAKLVMHPLLTWLLATFVFKLDPATTRVAVVLAALPTGTGPFMLAEYYVRDASLTSRVILATTIISVLTVPAYLALSAP